MAARLATRTQLGAFTARSMQVTILAAPRRNPAANFGWLRLKAVLAVLEPGFFGC